MARPPVKAQELASQLTAQIQAGDLRPGDWLPSERQLAEIHQVGRKTARSAVELLADAGLARLVPGSGARVAESNESGNGAAPELADELRDIREQLSEINRRLSVIEDQTTGPAPTE